ncbi:MAG TPA: hypothetical protein VHV83_11020, partial [Armatimonadota bacterium]|nr:hypothetical protein [Armatimonadota bacterium]
PAASPQAAFGIAFSWNKVLRPIISQVTNDCYVVQTSAGESMILVPGISGERTIGSYTTDALFATLAHGTLSLAKARVVSDEWGEHYWASSPLDVTMSRDTYRVSGMNYGDFAVFRGQDTTMTIRRGNGLEIYARVPHNVELSIHGEFSGCEVNGRPVEAVTNEGWTNISIPAVTPDTETLASNLSRAEGAHDIIHALHDIQDAMAWECAPLVREYLRWDDAVSEMPNIPLSTEATYVRLEAAWALMCLGDRESIPQLITLLQEETARNFNTGSEWAAKWWGFSTRCVTVDALTVLHATELLPVLPELLANVVVLHDKDAMQRALRILS